MNLSTDNVVVDCLRYNVFTHFFHITLSFLKSLKHKIQTTDLNKKQYEALEFLNFRARKA